ncbi:MAG TPA: PT domain-containing protein [Kineosporiaceae bacterium]|jgi:hypothetical protein|nr:PT domain-containing protein [Kineosporiaceae bacterium]
MTSSALTLAIFALVVSLVASLLVCLGALAYLRRVRITRPAIGTFNRRDMVTLFVLLATLPLLYVHLPREALTAILGITFASALSIGLRPLMRPTALWLTVGVLLGANIWMGNNLLGTVLGWQAFWAENSVVVLLAAICVANLYVQGGMKLQHVAWFAGALSIYDVVFTSLYPITDALVEAFLGFPLNPSVGMRWGFDNAAIGLGDLLVYGLYVGAALKAYGRAAARLAVAVVILFGAVVPTLVTLVIDYVDARTDTLVPAQAWFGPVALLSYWWLRRRQGPERTTAQFLASDDVVRPRPRVPAAGTGVGTGVATGVGTGGSAPVPVPAPAAPADSPVNSPADSPANSPADSPADSPAEQPSAQPVPTAGN